MRMRKKKHGKERLSACRGLLVEKGEQPIASSLDLFGKQGKLFLEIGSGKGGFACVMVAAVEYASSHREERPNDNLRFAIANADYLDDWFSENSVDALYLNFSDPWPKERHAKRRLTYRTYLEKYFRILKPEGKIEFKTDNAGLFAFTLNELNELGLTPSLVTDDLHHSPKTT
ncbi:MAG: tRNA (guanosine(46)-N7)-methyltransferase TrmB [Clostridia bacterium]|nr:tRNA (guanosine(46)-N7)-methyltransferase TrmB [Clostridia bacterium]